MKKTIGILIAFLPLFFLPRVQGQNVFGETIEVIGQRLMADTTLYQRLADRFNEGDITLTLNELSTLYYGYALRPGYNPVREERVLDAASALGRRERYEDAQNLLNNFLSKNPACLAALLEKWLQRLADGRQPSYGAGISKILCPAGSTPEKRNRRVF